jgi:hypothetical protein
MPRASLPGALRLASVVATGVEAGNLHGLRREVSVPLWAKLDAPAASPAQPATATVTGAQIEARPAADQLWVQVRGHTPTGDFDLVETLALRAQHWIVVALPGLVGPA